MNILILSCGTRNKVLQYFKENLDSISSRLIACDASPYAPALYEADSHYIVPRIDHPNYINIVLDICEKESVDAILSLIDPELSLLAKNSRLFEEKNIKIIGSNYDLCELSLDKYAMYLKMKEHGFACAKTYISLDEFRNDYLLKKIDFPVFVKPRLGSASINISKINDMESLELIFNQYQNLIIQEFLQGQEIGADCYIDIISGELVSVFTKNKLLMRAGETDKAVSFIDKVLNKKIEDFIKAFPFRAQIDIDIFKSPNGEYYFSEVNPRFGGGYPHAYECGVNHIKLIINNINNIVNPKQEPSYKQGLVMMKYNEIMIIDK